MNAKPAFVAMIGENVAEVSNLLASEGGFLLTVWPALNWDFTISLFDRPTLRLSDTAVLARHRGGNASNPFDDRKYRFGKAQEKKGLSTLFTSLDVDGYRLTIAAEWSLCSWVNFKGGQYFYVPESGGLSETFAHILENPSKPFDPPLGRDGIDRMISYMIEDLKTKTVVREIVAAGLVADAALGIC